MFKGFIDLNEIFYGDFELFNLLSLLKEGLSVF